MNLTQRPSRRKLRSVWADPTRRVRALESFAATDEDGGRDLLAAARLIADPDLREHIERHATDQMRHAQMFRGRAAALRSSQSVGGEDTAHDDLARDPSKGRHGFAASLCDELGEVACVAMLHVAAQRARDVFEIHADLNRDDPATQALFEAILEDERHHVAYTGSFLDRWREGGDDRAVREGLRRARNSRLLTRWKQLGRRSGASFSRLMLRVMYWTVLLPFGLLSRASRRRPASQPPRRTDLKSQY